MFVKSDNSNFLFSVFAYDDYEFLSKRKHPADNCGLVLVGGMNKWGEINSKVIAIGGETFGGVMSNCNESLDI